MSNQRSFVLFITLVIIVSYLYYESFLKKQRVLESLHSDKRSTTEKENQIFHKRNLLSYSKTIKDLAKTTINKQAAHRINQNLMNNKKRLRRDTSVEDNFLKWNFNVDIAKLNDRSKITKDEKSDVQTSRESGKGKVLRMAVYAEGQEPKNSNSELQRAWGAVGEFLRSYFGNTPEQLKENHEIIIKGSHFLDQLAESYKSPDKIDEKEKRPKFLNFFGNGNNENPPIEAGSGELQSLSFDSSTVSSEKEITDTDKESFIMKNFGPNEIFNHEFTAFSTPTLENLETGLNSSSEISKNAASVSTFPMTETLGSKNSNDFKVSNQGSDSIFKQTDTSENQSEFPIGQLESFCVSLLKIATKSPKFLDELESEGSGSIRNENSDNFSRDLNPPETTILTTNSPKNQVGAFQNLWNRITGFRFQDGKRNAKIIDAHSQSIDIEEMDSRFFLSEILSGLGSGGRLNDEPSNLDLFNNLETVDIPKEFSIKDCRNFFLTKGRSDITPVGLVLEDYKISNETSSNYFKIKNLSSHNQVKEIDIQDNIISARETAHAEMNVFKSSNDTTTFPSVDSVAKFEENIQELIDSVDKENTIETSLTVKPDTATTKLPGKKVDLEGHVNKEIINEIDFEVSTVKTENFFKESYATNMSSENSLSREGIVHELASHENIYMEDKEFEGNDLLPANTVSLRVQNRIIFPILMTGSGDRELADSEFSTSDMVENASFEMFDLGSGEGNINDIELFTNKEISGMTTTNEIFNFDLNERSNEYFSQTDNLELSTLDSLRKSDIDTYIKTSSVHETEINGTVLRISDTGDGREISIYTNENEVNCLNCLNLTPSIEEAYKPDTSSIQEQILFPLDSKKPDPYLNYEKISLYPEQTSVSINLEMFTALSSSPQPDLAQVTENCLNCAPVNLKIPFETLVTHFQTLMPFSDGIESKEKSKSTVSPYIEALPSNQDSKQNILQMSNETNVEIPQLIPLNDLSGKESNYSHQRYARISDEVSQTPMLSGRGRGARAHNVLPPNWPQMKPSTSPPILHESSSSQSLSEESSKFNPVDSTEFQQDTVIRENTEVTDKDIIPNIENKILLKVGSFEEFEFSSESQKTDLTMDKSTIKSELHTTVFPVTIPVVKTIPDLSINPRTKFQPKRFCASASECNSTLNERCISDDGIPTCDCGRAFKRHPESKKCQATLTVKTSLRLPGEEFQGDLRDRNSELFMKMEIRSLETMWKLLEHNPELFLTVAEIDVAGFEDGSLVVKWDIKLLNNGNETISDLARQIDDDLKEALEDPDTLGNLPLNVQNASISTTVVDSCYKPDLNYCHKFAECILDEVVGFKCECKKGYMDNSNGKLYPGEVCIETCYGNECGDHGECKVNSNGKKHCLCSGWFFGEKCEISGIIVIASFAGANAVIITSLFIIVCVCRKRRNRSYYNRNVTRFQPGHDLRNSTIRTQRIADAIALDEVGPGKISKYMNVSTPLFEQGPVIKVTSPSFPGSSIDYDSTFDKSPFSSEDNSRKE